MAVIKDVARVAGLSVSAVSKYLNHPDHVRQDTKDRIEAAIKELNYIPSHSARSLRTKRTQMIAVVVPDIVDIFYSNMFNTIKHYAQAKGYTPILYTIENDISLLKEYVNKASIKMYDGILLCYLQEEELMQSYKELRDDIPIVMFCGEAPEEGFNAVATDIVEGAYIASKHLIECGCKKIAYVGGIKSHKATREKYAGFEKAMKEADLKIDKSLLHYGDYRFQTGIDAAESCIRTNNLPDGVLAANDTIAAGYMKCVMSNKISIPDEIKVIGFDNIDLAQMYYPSISTVALPTDSMCRYALDILIDAISNPKKVREQTMFFKNELIVRESTKLQDP